MTASTFPVLCSKDGQGFSDGILGQTDIYRPRPLPRCLGYDALGQCYLGSTCHMLSHAHHIYGAGSSSQAGLCWLCFTVFKRPMSARPDIEFDCSTLFGELSQALTVEASRCVRRCAAALRGRMAVGCGPQASFGAGACQSVQVCLRHSKQGRPKERVGLCATC